MWKKLKTWQKVLVVVGVLFVLGLILPQTDDADTQANEAPEETKQEEKSEVSVVDKVNKSLDQLDEDTKRGLASTSYGGYQGDIEKVEAYGSDGVKIHVSTHYTENDDSEDGGQNIARKLMGVLCTDVSELSSVYVTSTSSGLDSRSVYRDDIPACR